MNINELKLNSFTNNSTNVWFVYTPTWCIVSLTHFWFQAPKCKHSIGGIYYSEGEAQYISPLQRKIQITEINELMTQNLTHNNEIGEHLQNDICSICTHDYFVCPILVQAHTRKIDFIFRLKQLYKINLTWYRWWLQF